MSGLVKVDFYGDSVWAGPLDACNTHGEMDIVHVAVKPICENLGVDWKGQLERIKRDAVLAEGIRVTRIPSPGGSQDTICLPLNLVPGFLFGISTDRIADPEARVRIITYKRECHMVLYQHFFGARAAPEADQAANDLYATNTKLRMIEVATKLRGKAAGNALWTLLDFPPLEDGGPLVPRGGAGNGIDFVRSFLDERTEEANGGRVNATALYEAFKAWAADSGAPIMTNTAFGRTLTALGVTRHVSSVVYYVGLRIRHRTEIVSQ